MWFVTCFSCHFVAFGGEEGRRGGGGRPGRHLAAPAPTHAGDSLRLRRQQLVKSWHNINPASMDHIWLDRWERPSSISWCRKAMAPWHCRRISLNLSSRWLSFDGTDQSVTIILIHSMICRFLLIDSLEAAWGDETIWQRRFGIFLSLDVNVWRFESFPWTWRVGSGR